MSIPFTPGASGRLPSFDFVLLPLGVDVNATGGPVTKTSITESASGLETLYSYYTEPRREYTGSFGPDYIAEILNIWAAGLGPRYGFMLHDPSDYQLTEAPVLPLSDTTAQIQKTYTRTNYFTSAVVRTLQRDILLPDPDTITVFRNGSVDTSWTLAVDGIITGDSIGGDTITVTGEFFVPVRMADDPLSLTMHVKDLNSLQQIKFIEVLPQTALIL